MANDSDIEMKTSEEADVKVDEKGFAVPAPSIQVSGSSSSASHTSSSALAGNSRTARTLRPFYPHQWLDCRDTENAWLEAQVIDVDEHAGRVKVHYKGYASKHDEWLHTNPKHPDSLRLAPLYTHVQAPRKLGEVKCAMGLRLDILDTSDKWLQGTVLDVDNAHDLVKIRYLGWDAKYDEWINSESPRLAPLGTMTGSVGHSPGRSGDPEAHSHRQDDPPAAPDTGISASEENEKAFRSLLLKEKGFTIIDQKDDGNCLFRTISHQVYGDPKWHDMVRQKCMDYIESEQRFFSNYIAEDFPLYIARKRRDAEWGDHVEIQAMSRIYQRPVDIYRYSTEPLRTSLGAIAKDAPPMRLSYHFQSHYNSVAHPNHNVHLQQCLKEPPGVVEDEAIKRSRTKHGCDLALGSARDDAHSTEMEALRVALGLSKEEFKNRNERACDEIVSRSLKELTERFERETAEAKRRSELEASEEEILKKLKEDSRKEHNAKEEEMLRRALEDSQSDDLKLAMELSMAGVLGGSAGSGGGGANSSSNSGGSAAAAGTAGSGTSAATDAIPAPIRSCMAAGYSLEMATIAFSVYGGKHPSDAVVARNMLAWLKAQGGGPASPAGNAGSGGSREQKAGSDFGSGAFL